MSNQELIARLKSEDTIKAAVEDVFMRVDKDKSGKINNKELKMGLKGLSKNLGIDPPTENDVNETLTKLDKNGDGQVDREEMKVLIKELFDLMIAELQK